MRLDDGFNRVDEGLRQQRGELNARFDAVESRLDARIDGLQRTMIRIGGRRSPPCCDAGDRNRPHLAAAETTAGTAPCIE
jgi:hypothetical protein